MNAVEIEEAVSQLAVAPFDANEFPFAFLEAFGNKETTIKKLKTANTHMRQIHERFGILVNRKAVAHYNPRLNPMLDPSLQSLYEEIVAARWRRIEREIEEWMEKRLQKRIAQENAHHGKLRDKMRRELGLI